MIDKNIMTCKFCGQDKRLIKAHIIPKAFFIRLRDGQDPPMMLQNKDGQYPKRAPIGVYDSNILCGDCESRFGDWDNYAQSILSGELKYSSTICDNDTVIAWIIDTYKYDLLKLFFISLLWRASVSIQKFYSKINLGPYEDIAKQFIEECIPGSPNEFSVFLARFHSHSLDSSILSPHPERMDGVRFYRFYLGNYVSYIKTDKRSTPEPFSHLILKQDKPLIITRRDIEHGKELSLIHKMVHRAKILINSNDKKS